MAAAAALPDPAPWSPKGAPAADDGPPAEAGEIRNPTHNPTLKLVEAQSATGSSRPTSAQDSSRSGPTRRRKGSGRTGQNRAKWSSDAKAATEENKDFETKHLEKLLAQKDFYLSRTVDEVAKIQTVYEKELDALKRDAALREDAAKYEARILEMELKGMLETQHLFDPMEVERSNRKLRSQIQELYQKNEVLEHSTSDGILKYRQENARLCNKLEKEFRDKVKDLEDRARAEAFATLDISAQEAVAERDSLKAYFSTMTGNFRLIEKKYEDIKEEHTHMKINEEITEDAYHEQVRDMVVLKKQLAHTLSAKRDVEQRLAAAESLLRETLQEIDEEKEEAEPPRSGGAREEELEGEVGKLQRRVGELEDRLAAAERESRTQRELARQWKRSAQVMEARHGSGGAGGGGRLFPHAGRGSMGGSEGSMLSSEGSAEGGGREDRPGGSTGGSNLSASASTPPWLRRQRSPDVDADGGGGEGGAQFEGDSGGDGDPSFIWSSRMAMVAPGGGGPAVPPDGAGVAYSAHNPHSTGSLYSPPPGSRKGLAGGGGQSRSPPRASYSASTLGNYTVQRRRQARPGTAVEKKRTDAAGPLGQKKTGTARPGAFQRPRSASPFTAPAWLAKSASEVHVPPHMVHAARSRESLAGFIPSRRGAFK